ncbi:hypothetical protein F4782DRAFT_513989 [Xylaria castorea]|nr:hypothetical protein F4782DRAFT_513989 [Xylaria castorea]
MLFFKCSDVPRHMREGFYWDGDNVINEDGFIDPNMNIAKSKSREIGEQCDKG